jgi:hypothetical protein
MGFTSSACPCQPFTWLTWHLSAELDFTKQVRNATWSVISPQEVMASSLRKQKILDVPHEESAFGLGDFHTALNLELDCEALG